MFYEIEIEDHIRVQPELFALPVKEAVFRQLQETYKSFIDKDLGFVIAVMGVDDVKEGIIIPGDGAAYYKSVFRLVIFKPEMNELVFGKISEITNFGAFMNIGCTEGMIHISQTMDDFVSFSKSNSLIGKNSKRVLKKGDSCLARIVAVSHKADEPKIGLTMRQPGLGRLEWIQEDKRKSKKAESSKEKEEGKKKSK